MLDSRTAAKARIRKDGEEPKIFGQITLVRRFLGERHFVSLSPMNSDRTLHVLYEFARICKVVWIGVVQSVH